MRVSIVLAALAAVASASSLTNALSKRQYPECAMTCAQSADYDGCSITDNTCMCKSQKFVNSMSSCLDTTCKGDDLTKSKEISNALCVAAGVPLTSTASTPATASATSAAASPSNNAAINLSGSPMVGALAAVAGIVFAL
ncbi:unnamed protein product [Rhizoctonia solani]|uniref:CFEM domain-containing protein n=1 Tax=Rhizoctonia solani TaxID=456999 RepID=A0A8H3E2X2_9AGAM|nr:unnamed protein product [Rhizoctonia solani]